MDIFKRHPLTYAIITFFLITLPNIINTYWDLYQKATGASMPSLNLGIWIWLLPLIGAILAVLVYYWLQQAKLLDDIKRDLVNMNVIERNTATKISSQIDLPEKTVTQICDDYMKLIGDYEAKLTKIDLSKDLDALIEHFYTVGQILDMNKAGLKLVLIDNEEYKPAKLDLEQKRLHLKPAKKHKFTQPNIVRFERLSYGVNSSIIIRGILAKFPEAGAGISVEIRRKLAEIESASETILKVMLDNLTKNWTKRKTK